MSAPAAEPVSQQDVEAAIGSLVCAGFSIDEILSWSWIRIFQSARAITVYHATVLEAIATPIVQALGGKIKKDKPPKRPKQMPAKAPATSEEALVTEDKAKLHALAALGLPVNIVTAEGKTRVGQAGLLQALAHRAGKGGVG